MFTVCVSFLNQWKVGPLDMFARSELSSRKGPPDICWSVDGEESGNCFVEFVFE